jgi:hypothetical protein
MEKVLEKNLEGSKTLMINLHLEERYPISSFGGEILYI